MRKYIFAITHIPCALYALLIFRTILEHFRKTAPRVLKNNLCLNNYSLVPQVRQFLERLNFTKIKFHEKLITLFMIINFCENELSVNIIFALKLLDKLKKKCLVIRILTIFHSKKYLILKFLSLKSWIRVNRPTRKNKKYFSREN